MKGKKIKREVCRIFKQICALVEKCKRFGLRLFVRDISLKKIEKILKQKIKNMEEVVFSSQCSPLTIESEINFLEKQYANLKMHNHPATTECEKLILVLEKYREDCCYHE